jgi:hypothetical protein
MHHAELNIASDGHDLRINILLGKKINHQIRKVVEKKLALNFRETLAVYEQTNFSRLL